MKKILILIILAFLVLMPLATKAGTCGTDPVYSYSAKGEVTSAVWVRDQACTATGKVLATLQKGWVVQITDKTDGWYKIIAPDGTVGWSGDTFFIITDKALTSSTPSTSTTSTTSLAWLKGYILLQVQQHGEAWYVNPTNFKRYYMKDGPTAYEMMRTFGLGITDADLAKIPKDTDSFSGDTALRSRLSGKILLQVQQHGEAWYIYPKTNKRYYLKDGAAAYQIMRNLGLGITDANLGKIASSSLATNTASSSTGSSSDAVSSISATSSDSLAPLSDTSIIASNIADTFTDAKFISTGISIPGDGSFQKGNVPAGFNYKIVMQHILDRINYERNKRSKASIVSDQRMVDTASVWAGEMYSRGEITHTRVPTDMMPRVWVWDNFKIGFRETWGWLYENIGGGSYSKIEGINESIEKSMDTLFDYYMSEESTNGIHYQTIMHDHLTHVGVGFYFDGDDNSGNLYTVLHYGALNKNVPVIDRTW